MPVNAPSPRAVHSYRRLTQSCIRFALPLEINFIALVNWISIKKLPERCMLLSPEMRTNDVHCGIYWSVIGIQPQIFERKNGSVGLMVSGRLQSVVVRKFTWQEHRSSSHPWVRRMAEAALPLGRMSWAGKKAGQKLMRARVLESGSQTSPFLC